MLKINEINSNPKQRRKVLLPTGESFTLFIEFLPQQYGWFIRDFVFEEIEIHNVRISNNLNILRQYKNIIPFGLACVSIDDREPSLLEDFSSGHSNLLIVTKNEISEYEEYISREV